MALNSSENFARNNIEGETRCVMQIKLLVRSYINICRLVQQAETMKKKMFGKE